MTETTPSLPGLSPVSGKSLIARFDGGDMSSDGGLLALREIEARLGVAGRLAACLRDLRAPERIRHGVAEMLRLRLLMIAAAYEDGNDADSLRHDPVFKLANGRLPDDGALCSQPTLSRLENTPDTRALIRMSRAMVELYCDSFRTVPRCITLDIDDTFDAVHGGQQLRLFNAYHDDYGFQPIVVFDAAGRPVAAMLRPAKRPTGVELRCFLRRLVKEIRRHWPRVDILLRADSHYCAPEVLDFCRAARVDFIFGVAPTKTLRRHVEALEVSIRQRQAAARSGDKLRRYKEFHDGAASWKRVERIIARIEVGPQGVDTRYIVTSLKGGSARSLYEGRRRSKSPRRGVSGERSAIRSTASSATPRAPMAPISCAAAVSATRMGRQGPPAAARHSAATAMLGSANSVAIAPSKALIASAPRQCAAASFRQNGQ